MRDNNRINVIPNLIHTNPLKSSVLHKPKIVVYKQVVSKSILKQKL